MIRVKTTHPDSQWQEFDVDSFLVLNDSVIRMKDAKGDFWVQHIYPNHTWVIEEVEV